MFIVTFESSEPPDSVPFLLRASAANSDSVGSAAIFVMQKTTMEGIQDRFSCVASAVQMVELGVDVPDTDSPYYRTASADILCNSASDGAKLRDDILAAVQHLVDDLKATETLSNPVTYNIT